MLSIVQETISDQMVQDTIVDKTLNDFPVG